MMNNFTQFKKVYCTGKDRINGGEGDACGWYGDNRQAKGMRCPICTAKVRWDNATPRYSNYAAYRDAQITENEEE